MTVHFSRSGNKRRRRLDMISDECPISLLPDSLLLHLVSSFPLVDVISLATVSKRWQHLWTMVPNLVFDQALGPEEHVRFVDKTMSLRRRAMKIEKLILPLYGEVTASHVDRWIDTADKTGVEELELLLDVRHCSIDQYKLPEQIYSAGWYLKKLNLSCITIDPIGSVRWNSLKSLSLSCCLRLSNETLVKILEGSPLLELMELKTVSGFDIIQVDSKRLKKLILDSYESDGGCRLKIIAPHLQSLTILCYRGKDIPLVNCPSLVEAGLHFEPPHGSDHGNGGCRRRLEMSVEVFDSLRHVENLSINKWFLQVMSMWKVLHFPSPLVNCKTLTLETGVMEWEIPGLANLLRCVPYLETLDINISDAPRHCGSCDFEEMGTALQDLHPLLDRLNVLKIHATLEQFSEVDFELIRYILENAKTLEKMLFYPQNCSPQECHHCGRVSRCYKKDAFGKGVRKLAELPRNSTKSVIRYIYNE